MVQITGDQQSFEQTALEYADIGAADLIITTPVAFLMKNIRNESMLTFLA